MCGGDVGDDALEQGLMARFGDGDAVATGAIAQHGRGTAPRQRHRQRTRRRRETQHRFHLRRQLVSEEQRPAAAERPAGLLVRRAQGLPILVEHLEEAAGRAAAVLAQECSVGQQRQRAAVGGQQQVPAALRGPCGG